MCEALFKSHIAPARELQAKLTQMKQDKVEVSLLYHLSLMWRMNMHRLEGATTEMRIQIQRMMVQLNRWCNSGQTLPRSTGEPM